MVDELDASSGELFYEVGCVDQAARFKANRCRELVFRYTDVIVG